MSNKSDKINTDDLIGKLCEELKPRPPRSTYLSMLIWGVGAVIYLVAFVYYLGLRPDITERFADAVFIFEIGIASSMFFTAALASSLLRFPDSIQRDWVKIIPVSLFFAFTLWVVANSIQEGMGLVDTMYLCHCAHEGMLMEALPILALIILTMRGNTTQPYWSMAMNILAVSSLGWIGLRFTCPMDQMGHSFFNHLIPIAIVGSGLIFFARKLFKW